MLLAVVAAISIAHPDFLTVSNMMTIGLHSRGSCDACHWRTPCDHQRWHRPVGPDSMSLAMVAMGLRNQWSRLDADPHAHSVQQGHLWASSNGTLIAVLELPPFIITLGMLGIAQGFALTSNGFSMYGFPKNFEVLEGARSWAFQYRSSFWPASLWFPFFPETKLGRYAYAIGGSEEAARRAGIPVRRFKIAIYSFCGVLVGIACIVLAYAFISAPRDRARVRTGCDCRSGNRRSESHGRTG